MQAGNGVETNTQGVQWESNKQLFINCLLLSSGKQSAIQLAMTLVVILAIFIIIGVFLPFVFNRHLLFSEIRKLAGAELGQAQLKLELDFTLINICRIKLY